jgi:hypothetical protein
MAEELPTLFRAWNFTETERKQACVFLDLHYKHIQNEAAIAATKLVTLNAAEGSESFMKEHIYLQGQLDALTALLRLSDDTKTELQSAFSNAQN